MTSETTNETPDTPPGPQTGPDDAGTRGTVEAFLYDIDTAFSAELKQATERLKTAQEAAERALTEAGAALGKSRETLLARLQEAKAAPALDAETLQRLATEIDGQLTWVFRKIRPGVDRELRALAPRRKPAQSILHRISRAYTRATAALPDDLPPPVSPEPEADGTQGAGATARRLVKPLAARLRYQAEANLQLSPRAMIEEILAARVDPKRHPLVKQYQKVFDQTTSRIADIWRGVRFHLEVAADDLEAAATLGAGEGGESADAARQAVESAELALNILSEAEQTLPPALAPLNNFFAELPAQLTREHQAFVLSLRQELENVDSWQNTLHHLLRRLFRKLLGLRDKARTVLEQGREEMVRSASSGLTQTGNLLRNVQGLLGKAGKSEEMLLNLTDLPSRAQVLERAGRLPPLYQRLFALGPLKNREFLVSREEELEELEEIFQRWQAGRACSVALVGPEGSGKTSLVNCFENQYGGKGEFLRTEIRRRLQSEAEVLGFFQQWLKIEEELGSLDELIAHLLAGPRRVLIVEGGHYLGLRTIGGYRGARAFLHVLMATRRHCLWLVTFRKYPWSRLDYQLGIGQYFTHQVRTLFHDQEQIREAILLRHRTSGLPLVFASEAEEGKPSEEAQAAAESRFFRELQEASSGSIDAAIYFWLVSISYDEQGKTLQVAPLGKPEFGFIRALGRDYLFALAEVVSHGGLTPEEYCSIFRREALEGRMLLDYLTHLNILQASDGETQEKQLFYSLNPIFFGPAVQALESLNILY